MFPCIFTKIIGISGFEQYKSFKMQKICALKILEHKRLHSKFDVWDFFVTFHSGISSFYDNNLFNVASSWKINFFRRFLDQVVMSHAHAWYEIVKLLLLQLLCRNSYIFVIYCFRFSSHFRCNNGIYFGWMPFEKVLFLKKIFMNSKSNFLRNVDDE